MIFQFKVMTKGKGHRTGLVISLLVNTEAYNNNNSNNNTLHEKNGFVSVCKFKLHLQQTW